MPRLQPLHAFVFIVVQNGPSGNQPGYNVYQVRHHSEYSQSHRKFLPVRRDVNRSQQGACKRPGRRPIAPHTPARRGGESRSQQGNGKKGTGFPCIVLLHGPHLVDVVLTAGHILGYGGILPILWFARSMSQDQTTFCLCMVSELRESHDAKMKM